MHFFAKTEKFLEDEFNLKELLAKFSLTIYKALSLCATI